MFALGEFNLTMTRQKANFSYYNVGLTSFKPVLNPGLNCLNFGYIDGPYSLARRSRGFGKARVDQAETKSERQNFGQKVFVRIYTYPKFSGFLMKFTFSNLSARREHWSSGADCCQPLVTP